MDTSYPKGIGGLFQLLAENYNFFLDQNLHPIGTIDTKPQLNLPIFAKVS